MGVATNVAVYMYHHICERPDSLTVTARQFESQIRGLAESGYRTLGADEFDDFMAGKPVPRKSVLLTFDDGYLDNWVYAHPILEKYGMKAVLFTITGLIGDGPVRAHFGEGKPLPPAYTHREAKERMFSGNADDVILRWSEIEEMIKSRTFEVHSHTHTHTRWDLTCSTPQEKTERFYDDMLASRQTLVEKLGGVSRHLCWPQGYFDEDYQRVAIELGFDHLYTTDARGQNKPGADTNHIYRVAARNRPYAWLSARTWLLTHHSLGPLYNQWKAKK